MACKNTQSSKDYNAALLHPLYPLPVVYIKASLAQTYKTDRQETHLHQTVYLVMCCSFSRPTNVFSTRAHWNVGGTLHTEVFPAVNKMAHLVFQDKQWATASLLIFNSSGYRYKKCISVTL